ncbi:MAG: hypothetical protein KC964_18370 [Candidatus Omnitrophica bacterium]|nr:hypothetical protein [Candidatus Omnitrophota bacterium]
MTRPENQSNHDELGPLARLVEALNDLPPSEDEFRKSTEMLLSKVRRGRTRQLEVVPSPLKRYPIAVTGLCAVVTLLGFLGVLSWYGDHSVAFAEVVEKIRTIKSYEYSISNTGPEDRVETFAFVKNERGYKSFNVDTGDFSVADWSLGKQWFLNASERTVVICDGPKYGTQTLQILNAAEGLQKIKDVEIWDEVLEGIPVQCFRFKNPDQSGIKQTWWIDQRTLLPIRIEVNAPDGTRGVSEDFSYSDEIDESIFDVQIPEGYTILDCPPSKDPVVPEIPAEEDLVEGLRALAMVNDSVFPDTLTVSEVNRLWRVPKNLPKEGSKELALRACLFSGQEEESLFQYRGEGVTLGESDTPICWWRLGGWEHRQEGTEDWRVVFGDLNVKTLTKNYLDSINSNVHGK